MAFKNHYTIVKDYTYNCLHYSYDRKWNELFVRKNHRSLSPFQVIIFKHNNNQIKYRKCDLTHQVPMIKCQKTTVFIGSVFDLICQ